MFAQTDGWFTEFEAGTMDAATLRANLDEIDAKWALAVADYNTITRQRKMTTKNENVPSIFRVHQESEAQTERFNECERLLYAHSVHSNAYYEQHAEKHLAILMKKLEQSPDDVVIKQMIALLEPRLDAYTRARRRVRAALAKRVFDETEQEMKRLQVLLDEQQHKRESVQDDLY